MENYITLSHLNDFIFCPRSTYFHQLYSIYNEQQYKQKVQIAGTAAHDTIDNGTYSSKKSILQGIEVYSNKYNIVGKIDMFDTDTGRLTERKKEIKVIYDGYIFQVYAQYFALTEMGYLVNEIIIYDMSHNTKYPIALPENNPEFFVKFEKVIADINSFDLELTPFTPNIEKCKKCIYSPLCDKSLC